jgi:predicted nuclease of restriction endonuclease-like (RecB) superfamily
LCCQTTWTNNLLIFSKSKSIEERLFYLNLSINENLVSRVLERHIDSAYYERSIIANQKLSAVLRELPQDVTNVFKDTYIFEFLDLPKPFSEKQLKKNLLAQLKAFILELGTDFVFMGEEYRLQVGAKDFFIDLLFFHRELSCLVSFELKINDFKPEYLGKMDFYLEALDRDIRKPHENPSIGVLLCKSKDDEIVEYAMSRNISPMLVADYETKFIDKKIASTKMA